MNGDFTKNVKQWVLIDNEIKDYNDKLKHLRTTRRELSENIIQYANNNKLTQSIINISDGQLAFVKTKIPSYLTLTHVEACIKMCIEDKDMIDNIMNVIKDTRASKIISDIKRTYNKDSK